jgi:hypothetical protein
MTIASQVCSGADKVAADALGLSLDDARKEAGALDDQRLASILDDLVDRVNGHYVAIAHDAAVVDRDD